MLGQIVSILYHGSHSAELRPWTPSTVVGTKTHPAPSGARGRLGPGRRVGFSRYTHFCCLRGIPPRVPEALTRDMF